ncbi:hypothetical protein EF918_32270 [Streptomyces sp. WAC06614]|nr:hypothetical protein EF918_32270 [Streptomyces sp. WAC06614]
MPTTPPPDDENDKDSFKVTEQVLLDFATKFESLLLEFSEDPALQSLTQWSQGAVSGDDGLLLPGNTKNLPSAGQVQAAFKGLCTQTLSALDVFRGTADSAFLTLKTVKAILDGASDDAISVTEMWEILNSIQQGSRNQGPGNSTPPPTNK